MSDDGRAEPSGADASDGATDDERSPLSDEDDGDRDVERYVRYALVAGLTLLALVALIRFYFAASNTIDTWVADEYRSLFQAAFNLVVLLLAGVGISWQVRRLA